jgi:Xaa-Pro aminopeptidase
MIADLDRLLNDRGIGAIVVPMHELQHSSFRWLSRSAKLTKGFAVKVAGEEPLIIHFPMERDEAAAAGVRTASVHDFGWDELFKSEPSVPRAYSLFFGKVLDTLGVRGSVAFAGAGPVDLYFEIISDMESSGRKIARTGGEDIVLLARKRKDARELELIADVGRRTEEVVDGVRRLLRSATIRDGIAEVDGRTLMIGDLKKFVTSEIQRLGMIEDHETILSQGRDAGIPHSRGDASAPVRGGIPIILDIFPADAANGYFFDFTRTFCVGEVPDELSAIHAEVLAAFELAAEKMTAGTRAADYQNLVCDYFESKGYATIRADAATTDGYVHSLGHGVGLNVHEKPSFYAQPSNTDTIEAGDVLTIEPGLYFPDREIGVRVEETFYIGDDGRAHTFCRSDRGLRP